MSIMADAKACAGLIVRVIEAHAKKKARFGGLSRDRAQIAESVPCYIGAPRSAQRFMTR